MQLQFACVHSLFNDRFYILCLLLSFAMDYDVVCISFEGLFRMVLLHPFVEYYMQEDVGQNGLITPPCGVPVCLSSVARLPVIFRLLAISRCTLTPSCLCNNELRPSSAVHGQCYRRTLLCQDLSPSCAVRIAFCGCPGQPDVHSAPCDIRMNFRENVVLRSYRGAAELTSCAIRSNRVGIPSFLFPPAFFLILTSLTGGGK